MKISCLPVSLFPELISGRMSVADWVRLARAAGLDGVDLSILIVRKHTPVELQQLRRELGDGGLPVTMITTYPDFSHPDPRQVEREMEILRDDIAVASQLGCAYLRITAGQSHPGINLSDTIQRVVEQFERAAEVADRFGVALVFENHSQPGAWELPDFAFPTEIFLRIAERLAGSRIGIHFDTANTLAYGDDPLPVLDQVINQVVTVHAADIAVRGQLAPVLLGNGIAPLRDVFARLKTNGFDGWICIEEASRTGADGIQRATEYVRRTWDEICR